jgi:hypothetical protein
MIRVDIKVTECWAKCQKRKAAIDCWIASVTSFLILRSAMLLHTLSFPVSSLADWSKFRNPGVAVVKWESFPITELHIFRGHVHSNAQFICHGMNAIHVFPLAVSWLFVLE